MASITEKGKLYIKGEVKSGTSRNGNPWANQQIVVEVYGFNNSIKRVALTTSNVNNLNLIQELPLGAEVEIQYSVSAREWNGKWYSDVELISIKSLAQSMQTATRPSPSPKATSEYEVCQNFCTSKNCDYHLGSHPQCSSAIHASGYNPPKPIQNNQEPQNNPDDLPF